MATHHPFQSRTTLRSHSGSQSPGDAVWIARELIDLAEVMAGGSAPVADPLVRELIEAERVAPTVDAGPAHLVNQELTTRIVRSWEHGWQPRDLVHTMRRVSAPVGRLAAGAVLEQAERFEGQELAPAPWREQLRDLAAEKPCADWDSQDPDAWRIALRFLYRLRRLRPHPLIGPPPSQWRTAAAAHDSSALTDRVLAKIRALLAKAEGTDFAEEAEAFTAKAQALMTRHSIDEALVHAGDNHRFETGARRLHIDDPYATAKVQLLGAVAVPNRVKAVWDGDAGFATLVGGPAQLEQVEMVFVSLLIQATRAMTAAGRATRAGGASRSRSFRRSFLVAYAARIGERLSAAAEAVGAEYGTDLVPVFARQEQAVTEEFERLFPHTQRFRASSYDARGWQAGSAAADRAVLPRGRLAG